MNDGPKRYTAVIADSDADTVRQIRSLLEGSGCFRVAAFAFNGKEAAELIMKHRPHLVAAGLVMPEQDCFAMLEELGSRGYSAPTRFVMTSAISKPFVLRRAGELGVDYVFLKPIDEAPFVRRVLELMENGARKKGAVPLCSGENTGGRAAQLLKLAGVPAHLKGWRYLRDAVEIAGRDFSAVDRLMQRVYAPVAEKHGATPQQVERAMRHAVKAAFERMDISVGEALFGRAARTGKGRPANGEFIAALANRLRIGRPEPDNPGR